LLLCAALASAGGAPLAERFREPPADMRILKIIHSWPDAPEAQDQLMARLQRQGFGGVVCNVAFDHYLESDAKWQAFTRAVQTAQRAGLVMWLYDERGYPSGNAGGLVLRDHPEWEARGLLAVNEEFDPGPVELTLPPGRPWLAAAYPVRDGRVDVAGKVDLSGRVRDGQLRWEAPPGRWHVMAITESRLYEGTHAELNLHQKMPYPNLLQPEPTARFIELTHQRYAGRLGPDLGKYFMATFTDEPSLMSCFIKAMPYRPLPWAPHLPGEFRKRRGYALDDAVIPSLLADTGPASAKHRHDFWLTVGELVSGNFFGQIQTWCRRHNIPSGGHLLMEESLVAHVPLYGDFFRCARRLDAPSIDCLTSVPAEVPWASARLLASAAELDGRALVMSETSDHAQRYRPGGDRRPKRVVTEEEIRGACNRQMVAGVNCITSYSSFTDLTDEALRRLNEWVGRCCAGLRNGHQVADVALLYPVESLWTRFTPARQWAREAPGASRIEHLYQAAAESLFAAHRDFTIVDSRTLAEAQIEGDALVHRSLRWRVVVLPGADTLPLEAWENLARFVRSGGVVVALGARPANSAAEFPSPRAQKLAREMFGEPADEPRAEPHPAGGAGVFLPRGAEGLLPAVLQSVLEPDARVSGRRAPLRVTHRRLEGREVYFVVNDSANAWTGRVSFPVVGQGEQWDPGSGRIMAGCPAAAVQVNLGPYGATLFTFPGARAPKRLPAPGGVLPGLTRRPMPVATPAVGRGEFVRAELAPDPARSQPGRPVWQARAALTKGGVDTFLFLTFAPARTLDLGEADSLALETWVPEGQRTPNQLLVILREQGGGDFLASTGRSLGAPGHERVFVPLARFQLAGWSQDADGVLDPSRVSEVRIGWGGYLGREGETVQFSLALPEILTLTSPAGRHVGGD
jgi:hypothetical protein